MVVWFGLTWLPHNVVSLIIEYDETQTFFRLYGREELDISYLLNLFTHCFAMSNNVVNPLLYAWLNPTFQKLVIKTISLSLKTRYPQREFTPSLMMEDVNITISTSLQKDKRAIKRPSDNYDTHKEYVSY
ncbi:hypothetical protein KIN20_011821 [Parelaphostrongylus tenuis]|uniref:G-protein coupled receptors family 1 profile domain-containing protein n=1 Tax=Parelaphostrongylus tenuis TaxID=148309 RepID=A0AAD5MW01_PARTN|nr:hypothetical protein KIN20_011821 [Parelaphostrongylus tenuis]